MDLQSTILGMIDASYALRSPEKEHIIHGENVMKELRKNIQEIKDYPEMFEDLQAFYGIERTIMNDIDNGYEKIKNGQYEEGLRVSINLRNKLKMCT